MRRALTRGHGRASLLAAGVVLAAVVVTVLVLVSSGSDEAEKTAVTVRGNSLALVDPDGNRLVDSVALGGRPTRLAYGEGAFWAVVPEAQLVVRVNEETRSVQRLRVGVEPYDVAVGAGAAWVPDHDLRRLLRVDAETGDVGETADLGAPAVSAGYGFGAAWVVVVPGELKRVDPEMLNVTQTTSAVAETTEFLEPKLAFADDALWIASPANGTLTRIDPASGAKDGRDVFGITGVAVADSRIWATNEAGYVSGLDGKAERIPLGGLPLDVSASEGTIWVADNEGKAVKRVDTGERRVVATIKLGQSPIAVAVGDRLIGVAVEESES